MNGYHCLTRTFYTIHETFIVINNWIILTFSQLAQKLSHWKELEIWKTTASTSWFANNIIIYVITVTSFWRGHVILYPELSFPLQRNSWIFITKIILHYINSTYYGHIISCIWGTALLHETPCTFGPQINKYAYLFKLVRPTLYQCLLRCIYMYNKVTVAYKYFLAFSHNVTTVLLKQQHPRPPKKTNKKKQTKKKTRYENK